MSKLTPSIICIVATLWMLGCSHFQKDPDAAHHQSAYMNIKGDAPESLKPKWKDGKTMDATFMQTKADYHFTMAESYALEGNVVKAIENYKLTLVYDPNSPRVRFRLATEYVKLGLISESLAQCQEVVRLEPKFADAHLLMGGLYSAMKLFDKAEESYKTILKTDPDHKEAKIFIGALLVDQEKYTKAIKYFQRLARKTDGEESHRAWYYLGRVYLEKGGKSSILNAISAFKTSLQIKSDYVESVLALGDAYKKQGRLDLERKAYESYQKFNGADYNIAQRLSQLYMDEDKFSLAYEQLRVIESRDNDNLNVSLKIAFILIEQKKYKEAISRLEDLIIKAPESDKIRFYLGAVYEEVKDYNSAINHFTQIPFTSAYFDDAIIHKSYLYKLMKKYSAAVDTMKKAIFHKDNNPKFYALYASYLDEQGDYKEAQKVLAGASRKFPQNVQIHFHLGAVHDKLGDKKNTVRYMEKVLELDGNHIQALNYLAFVYAENTKNLTAAENLAKKALALKPKDGYILDTLGWILFKQDRLQEAIKFLEQAHTLVKTEGVIADHLGDAYYKYKLPRKAKKMYQMASELTEDDNGKEKIKKKITAIENKIQVELKARSSRIPASSP